MSRAFRTTLRTPQETIPLLRGGAIVSSFAGAFGSTLRETRLTALLGYLIALEPEPFLAPFGFRGSVRSVSLETKEGGDRTDVLVDTDLGRGIVEAKVDATDPFKQALRYRGRWKVLLTHHLPSNRQQRHGFRYLQWSDLYPILKSLMRSKNQKVRFVSTDLVTYMEEHRMIRTKNPVEIYAREINEETTLGLFLKARLYGCRYRQNSRLHEALYFAPHFGMGIAKRHPGVRVGIGYFARIESIEVMETWKDLREVIQRTRGKAWWNSHREVIEPLRRQWKWPSKRSLLFLATPRLAFNPPVRKERLQAGHGWLSKQFFSFDQLFDAWGR